MRKDLFRDQVLDSLHDLRGLDCKALYSGYGFWCATTFFGIVSKATLYFRVKDNTRADFQAARSCPLLTRGGKYDLEFLEVPAFVVKDPELLVDRATRAIEGARKTKKGRKRKIHYR